MAKKSDKYQKIGVILIGILFLTSMAGVALNSSTSGPRDVELPDGFVLSEDLTADQRYVVYNSGGSVVVFRSSPLCGAECMVVRGELEALTSRYSPYVYLVLISDDDEPSVNVGNYLGVADFNMTDVGSEVEDNICDVIGGHPACIERRAISAVMNYNATVDVTDDGADSLNDSIDDVNQTE